jgi:PAS domain S-box-containing protein
MKDESTAVNATSLSDHQLKQFFPGNSELAARMRALDWSQTDLGSPQQWSENLRVAVSLCLTSRIPIVMYWGANFTVLYNDAYISFLGNTKHPRYLGQPGRECWQEIWDTIRPMLESVYATGEATLSEDVQMFFARSLPLEEVYVRFTFGPILASDGKTVQGIFCPCTETTEQVVSARRLETLRKLGLRAAQVQTVHEVCQEAARVFGENPEDIPFAAIYLGNETGDQAIMNTFVGFSGDGYQLPFEIHVNDAPSPLPIASVLRTHTAQCFDLGTLADRLLSGLWSEPVREAIVLPIFAATTESLAGLLVVGVSSRRVLDTPYRTFFDLVSGHIGTAIADARAYEAERQRAEALAEIDRAKTVFFSNVSHEFRTPLTLMLSPLEDAIANLSDTIPAEEREQLKLVQRNGLRLLKLVNTLLDFSRIEAGRVQASYEPTDLATFTAELASVFRSAIERANLRLVVDCPPMPERVYVDREMWEKIVFNLLSNAFKFTFVGDISVSLHWKSERIELTVRDTGIGIPATELPHLFERFHRVKGAQGRSIEGSGIGLSLVQELVKLHQGTIKVTSVEGGGTCFNISIPTGMAHLPQDRIGATRTLASTVFGANPYLEEALRWFSETDQGTTPLRDGEQSSPSLRKNNFSSARIILADDNVDMRDYVRRLLSQQYEVEAVSDGVAALSAIRQQAPDLVLTDVMMPNLDGFGLLQALRSDPQTREVPIIMLSARAGEEARIEGLAAGADDYLIKPFSARELLARVEATLKLAQLRREAAQTLQRSEERYRAFVRQSSEGIWRFEVEQPLTIDCSEEEQIQHFYQHAYLAECNQVIAQMYGASSPEHLFGTRLSDLLVPSDPRNWEYLRAFIRAGYRLIDAESYEVDRQGNLKIFLNNLIGIIEDGKVVRAWGTQRDITDRKQAEEARAAAEQRYRIVGELIPFGVWEADLQGNATYLSQLYLDMTGKTLEEYRQTWQMLLHPDDLLPTIEGWNESLRTGGSWEQEFRIRGKDGHYRTILARGLPVRNVAGEITSYVGANYDITKRKRAEVALRERENMLSGIVGSITDALIVLDKDWRFTFASEEFLRRTGISLSDLIGNCSPKPSAMKHTRKCTAQWLSASAPNTRFSTSRSKAGLATKFIPLPTAGWQFIHATLLLANKPNSNESACWRQHSKHEKKLKPPTGLRMNS